MNNGSRWITTQKRNKIRSSTVSTDMSTPIEYNNKNAKYTTYTIGGGNVIVKNHAMFVEHIYNALIDSSTG